MTLLTRFAQSLPSSETLTLDLVRQYFEWQAGQAGDFTPTETDDVHLRTYLLHLQNSGASRSVQRQHLSALRRFYNWAKSEGLIETTPDSYFSLERPILTRDQIRKRADIFSSSPAEREIERLRALNHLAEQLNRTAEAETMLQIALETILSALHLHTGWAFLAAGDGDSLLPAGASPQSFILAAAQGLPPGLERDDRSYLRDPDICHCQYMLQAGQLTRAVNIVECTRLQASARDAGDNQDLLFHASVPLKVGGLTLGIINVATEEWQFLTAADLTLLSTAGAQVAAALQRARLYDLARSHEQRLERELQLAREIQVGLMLDEIPEIPGFSLAARWQPAREMSGDFYDVFALPDGRWGIVVADVTDKGAPAALYMSMTRSLLHTHAATNPSPASTLSQINRYFLSYSSSGMFVTLFYGMLDPTTRQLTYASAGHQPPLLRRQSGTVETIPPTGPVVGIFDDALLTDAHLTLHPGDALLIYTDGIPDALNARGEEFGMPRLIDALTSASLLEESTPLLGESAPLKGKPASPTGASHQLDHIHTALSAFTANHPPYDDITSILLVSTPS